MAPHRRHAQEERLNDHLYAATGRDRNQLLFGGYRSLRGYMKGSEDIEVYVYSVTRFIFYAAL